MSGWQCPVCGIVNAPWAATCAVSHARPAVAATTSQPVGVVTPKTPTTGGAS